MRSAELLANLIDRALAEADTAFLRFQDVRQVLSDFLGVRLPA